MMLIIRIVKFLFCWSSHVFNMTRLKGIKHSEWLEAIKADGLYMSNAELRRQDIAQIKRGIDQSIVDDSVKIWSDNSGSDKRIFGFEKIFNPDLFNDLARRYAELGEIYLGRKIHSYFVLAARMDYVKGNVGSGGGWHRDSAFNHQFKVIVYLGDVREEAGPFQYILASHLPKISDVFHPTLGMSRFNEDQIMKYFDEDRLATVTGKAGDAIFVDTRGVHRGKPIEKGCRYAITFYFFDRKIMKHIDEMTNLGVSSL